MNKKVLVTVVILLLLLLGGVAFMMSKKSKKTDVASPETKVVAEEETKKQSLKDLLASNVAQKCSYSDTYGSTAISGTSYLSGGKVRGDFSTTAENGQVSSGHMIYDGKFSYVWIDGTTSGFKMAIDTSSNTTANANQQGLDMNKAMDYDCGIWVTDQSQFTPPDGVTFTEYNMPASSVTPSGTSVSGSQSACSYCDAMTGDAKTQCRTSLNCK